MNKLDRDLFERQRASRKNAATPMQEARDAIRAKRLEINEYKANLRQQEVAHAQALERQARRQEKFNRLVARPLGFLTGLSRDDLSNAPKNTASGLKTLASYMINPLKLFEGIPVIGKFLSGAGGYATLGGMAVYEMIKEAASVERSQVAFSALSRGQYGSRSDAVGKQLVKEIRSLAAETPYTSHELTEAAQMLMGYGTNAPNIRPTLKMLGDVTAGLGGRTDMNEMAYLFGTIQQQAHAFTRDINQFANRGIPIFEELAKVTRRNKYEIQGMVEAGEIGFEEVRKAFDNMTNEGGRFHNFMEKQSKTIYGLVSNIKDFAQIAMGTIGQKMIDRWGLHAFFDDVQKGLKDTEGFIGRNEGAINSVLDGMQAAAKLGGVIAMSWGAIFTTGLELFGFAFPKAVDSFKDLISGGKDVKLVFSEFRDRAIDTFEAIATGISTALEGIVNTAIDIYNKVSLALYKVTPGATKGSDITERDIIRHSAKLTGTKELGDIGDYLKLAKVINRATEKGDSTGIWARSDEINSMLSDLNVRGYLPKGWHEAYSKASLAGKHGMLMNSDIFSPVWTKLADRGIDLYKTAESDLMSNAYNPIKPIKTSDSVSSFFKDFRGSLKQQDAAYKSAQVNKNMQQMAFSFLPGFMGWNSPGALGGNVYSPNSSFMPQEWRLGYRAAGTLTDSSSNPGAGKVFSDTLGQAIIGLKMGTISKKEYARIINQALPLAEQGLGLGETRPLFAGAVQQGTQEALSIENRWKVLGNMDDPTSRIENVLNATKTIQEQQSKYLERIANAINVNKIPLPFIWMLPGG